jgi:hypothetical protein
LLPHEHAKAGGVATDVAEERRMSRRLNVIAAMWGLTLLASVALVADTHLYTYSPLTGEWVRTGSSKGMVNDPDSVVLCDPPGLCVEFSPGCEFCHTSPVDRATFEKDEGVRHRRVHFPNAQLRLMEGQRVMMGTLSITQTAGRLTLTDARGRRHVLPPDTIVVGGRNRQPLMVTYGGSSAPMPQ